MAYDETKCNEAGSVQWQQSGSLKSTMYVRCLSERGHDGKHSVPLMLNGSQSLALEWEEQAD